MLSKLLNFGHSVEKSYPLQMNVNLVHCGFGGLLLIILVPLFMVGGTLTALISANALRMGLFYYYSQKRVYLPYKFDYLYSVMSAAAVATCFGQISA
jgi:O-antigen/teichoic acid export membrane protein